MRRAVVTMLMIAVASACGGATLEEQYADGTCRFLEAIAAADTGLGRAWDQRLQVARDDGLDRDAYVDAVIDACPDVAARAREASEAAEPVGG